MDNARIAALAAVALGGFAMMTNFLIMPMLMNRVSKLHVDLQARMQVFKAKTDQAWDEMMHIRREYMPRHAREAEFEASGSNGALLFPFGYTGDSANGQNPSDLQQQTWDQLGFSPVGLGSTSVPSDAASSATTNGPNAAFDNGCPPGPPGPAGENGKDGMDGPPGVDGLQGQNAQEMKFEDLDMCSICPGGPKGPAGPAGPPGPPGKKGKLGEAGKNGINGTTGAPGPAGKRGFQGLPGKPGTKGKPGKPAPGGKGKPGPKGATGPIGRAGPQGPPGNSSTLNNGTGLVGLRGLAGLNGIPGKTGQPGPAGQVGIAGGEGGYCPCPKELRGLGADPDNATAIPISTLLGTTPVGASPVPGIPAPSPLPSAPLASSIEATILPLQKIDEQPPAVMNFGGGAPAFGPPGSLSPGGVVALSPSNIDAFGGAPPSERQPNTQAPGDGLVSLLGVPPADNVENGGLNNLFPRTRA